MPNHLDPDMQESQSSAGKLVLPAPSEPTLQASPHMLHTSSYPEQTTAYPQHSLMPPNPSVKKPSVWRKDPAYLVLVCAIALVVISAIAFVAFGATAILSNNGLAYSQTPTAPTPSGTVDAKPNLGTPATGPGSNQTSQPPTIPTPNLNTQPSPTNQPQPGQGALSIQIVNLPKAVPNNSRVLVDVQANQPGIQVRLQVSYNVAPFSANSGTHITDGNGQAVLPWTVRIFSFHNNSARATIQAIAIDQNGQQVASQAVVVAIEN